MKFFGNVTSLASRYVGGASPLFLAAIVSLALVPSSSSAQSVFYVADQEVDERNELFYRDKAGAVKKISAPLVAGGDVEDVLIDAKGNAALYTADGDVNDRRELYKVDVKSGVATKASGPLQPGGYVLYALLSPTGTDAIYTADVNGSNKFEVFHSNLKTGEVKKVNEPLPVEGDVMNIAISPNGRLAAYSADKEADNDIEVYLADLVSGAVKKISSGIPAGAYSVQVEFDATGKNLLYHYRTSGPGERHLFHYNIKSGALRPVPNTSLPDIWDFSLNAKGTGIAYITRVAQSYWLEYLDLKTGLVKPLAASLPGTYYFQCQLDPKGKFVLFIAGDDDTRELYKADLKTGMISKVSYDIQPTGRVWNAGADSASKNIYYVASANPDKQELFGVDVKTGTGRRINAPMPGNDEVLGGYVDTKSKFAVYLYRHANSGERRLHIVDLKSGAVSDAIAGFPTFASVQTLAVPSTIEVYGD